jgi:hypothetical protein
MDLMLSETPHSGTEMIFRARFYKAVTTQHSGL